jgi:hypothetical protein
MRRALESDPVRGPFRRVLSVLCWIWFAATIPPSFADRNSAFWWCVGLGGSRDALERAARWTGPHEGPWYLHCQRNRGEKYTDGFAWTVYNPLHVLYIWQWCRSFPSECWQVVGLSHINQAHWWERLQRWRGKR